MVPLQNRYITIVSYIITFHGMFLLLERGCKLERRRGGCLKQMPALNASPTDGGKDGEETVRNGLRLTVSNLASGGAMRRSIADLPICSPSSVGKDEAHAICGTGLR